MVYSEGGRWRRRRSWRSPTTTTTTTNNKHEEGEEEVHLLIGLFSFLLCISPEMTPTHAQRWLHTVSKCCAHTDGWRGPVLSSATAAAAQALRGPITTRKGQAAAAAAAAAAVSGRTTAGGGSTLSLCASTVSSTFQSIEKSRHPSSWAF